MTICPRNKLWNEKEDEFLVECIQKRKLHPEDIVPLWEEKFGFSRTRESLIKRCYTLCMSFDHTVPKRKQMKTKVEVKKAVEADVKEAKLQQKLLEVQTKYRLLTKEQSLGDRIVQVLRDEAKVLPKVHFAFERPAEKRTQEEVGLALGDFHIGERVSLEETYGFGEYDFDIFVKRLRFLGNSIKSIVVDKLRGYQFDKIHIFGMGDMVSGLIHEELAENAESIIFQVLNGAFVTAQFILNLQHLFPKIEIDGVLGNHGRLHQKKRYKRKYQNWDYIFYQFLGVFLAANDQIKWNWAKSPFLVKKIYDWGFLSLHGDDIVSWMGIPWYGIERAMWRLGDLLQSKGFDIHYRLLGHFHNTGELDRVPGEIVINGSMIGGTEHGLGKMFVFDRPTQVFFGVHKEIGMTWRYPLRLDLPEVVDVEPYEYNLELDAGKYMRKLLESKKNFTF